MKDALALEVARTRYPPIWTIYDHPSDYPDHVTVRVWYGELSEPNVALVQSIEEARTYVLSAGACMCLRRLPDDDPVIVESWI